MRENNRKNNNTDLIVGTATKACLTNGVWGETNVLDCLPVEYQNYLNEVLLVFQYCLLHFCNQHP